MTAIMAETKPEGQIEAEKELIKRHLRRRIGVTWRTEDPDSGTFDLFGIEWHIDVSFKSTVQKHQVVLSVLDIPNGIDRYFATRSGNHYTCIHEAIIIHSTLRLVGANNLQMDDF